MDKNLQIKIFSDWRWTTLRDPPPLVISWIFLLLTRVYTSACVSAGSTGKDVPGELEILDGFWHLNNRIEAYTPDQSFSRQRDCDNKVKWTSERLDSVWKQHEHVSHQNTLYIKKYYIDTNFIPAIDGILENTNKEISLLSTELHCLGIWNGGNC